MKTQIERSLQYSIKDGIAYAIMFGIGETYFVAYALYLKATTFDIAFLSAFPILFGSLVQLLSVWIQNKGVTRQRLILIGACIQGATWLPIIIVPLFFSNNSVHLLIAFVILYYMAGNFIVPVWTDWMGDLIQEKKRGRFFAHRTRLINATTFGAMVVGGIILHMHEVSGDQAKGFITIFAIACAGRCASVFFLLKMEDPFPPKKQTEIDVHALHFSQLVPNHRALIFTLFVSLIQFATFIAAPYFSVYMLKTMQLDYVVFMSLLAVSVMTQFLTLNYWGKLSDYVGNRLILVYTSMLLPVLPILWLFSTNLMYLCFIQILGGLTWAGFSLCVNNSIYELIEPKQRPNFCAFYNVVCHICIACGALLGGWLASLNITKIDFILFQTNFDNPLFTVFLVSGLCRLTVVVMLIKYIHDEPIPFSTRRTYIRVTRLFPGLMIDWIVKKKDR